jgi:flagellar biosynthesis GTPase FlhF
MLTIRLLIVAVLFGAVVFGDDITLPLDDGTVLISHARFIRNGQYTDSKIPELFFVMENRTSSPWRTLKLQFDIGGLCNGEPRQWTLPVVTSLGWAKELPVSKEYTDTVFSLVGKVDGCKTEIIKASLVLAENPKTEINGLTGERVDLEKQLQELKAKQDAEAAAQAEEERQAAEAQAKKDAAEAARRKRLAADQKRKQAEADARYAKMKAEEDARAAEERRKIRAACSAIYQSTADKKISNLTVKEEQQVRTCQALGLYPPQ